MIFGLTERSAALAGAWLALTLQASCGPELQPLMGMPLSGLTEAEHQLFKTGQLAFAKRFVEGEGLGPLFNDFGCGSCHNTPVLGGFSRRTNTRFGRAGEPFDPLSELGGTVFQFQATSLSCEEFLPREADVLAERGTPALYGFGLIEAIPDSELVELQASGPDVRGLVHWVKPLESDEPRAGRFGWKAQIATLLSFSADASLEEMGITNRLLPHENAPNGDLERLALGDATADPEDRPDKQGFEFIDRVTHYQRLLAPPPQTPKAGMSGERVFAASGCAACHTPSFTTPPSSLVALSEVTFRPYSNFLLHDMGELGDGIVDGEASERLMRTAPLWGLSSRDAYLHDFASAGGDFEANVRSAIERHAGEAEHSRDLFLALTESERAQLFAFLRSLGRAEYDWDEDRDVDLDDAAAFVAALDRESESISPDDPEAVFDVDRDGALTKRDFMGLLSALRQSANRPTERFFPD